MHAEPNLNSHSPEGMESWDAFVAGLDDTAAGIPARAPKADLQRFPCQQCGGTGLWTARRKNYRGNDKCLACQGRGFFLTDENARCKARQRRKDKQVRDKAAAAEAFDAENPGLREFLRGAAGWSEFAGSMLAQLNSRDTLSVKQIAAARSMQAKCVAREEAKAAATRAVEIDLTPVRAMFEHAAERGHERPTFRAEGLVISRAPMTGNNPGALYVKRDGAYQGKVVGTEFKPVRDCAADTKALLAEIAKNPLESAVRYGQKTGTCSCCGRRLVNAESVALGIGPVCRERWGL